MRVSFIIHTPFYRYITDKIAKHLKCQYDFHTTMEQVYRYKPDITVSGLAFKELEGKYINIFTGHGLTWGSGIWSKSNGWYDYVFAMSDFMKEEIIRFGAEPKKEIWVTGWATTDNLFSKKVRPDIFENIKRPVIFYGPTSNPSSYPYLKDIHTLIPLGATLIIKPHPVPGVDGKKIAEENIKDFTNIVLLDGYKNPNDYIPYVDLVISDKSSVLFYPLALPEKPIIQCFFPNIEKRWRGDMRAYACIEYRWLDAWRQIRSKEELRRAVVEELENPMRNYQTRKKYGDILFGNLRDGQSGRRMAEKIMALEGKI